MLKRIAATLPQGLQEELKRFHFRHLIKSGKFATWEPEFLELPNLINPGDWVIDVGANIGHYTFSMSSIVGKKGRVIAFEPIPTTFAHLATNMLFTKDRNITLINAAASTRCVSVNMDIPSFSTGLKNYYQASISNGEHDGSTPVLAFSIDELNLPHKVSLIKIDAEGHEPEVINGAKQLIERDRPILILETFTDEILNFLRSLGYKDIQYPNSPNRLFKISS